MPQPIRLLAAGQAAGAPLTRGPAPGPLGPSCRSLVPGSGAPAVFLTGVTRTGPPLRSIAARRPSPPLLGGSSRGTGDTGLPASPAWQLEGRQSSFSHSWERRARGGAGAARGSRRHSRAQSLAVMCRGSSSFRTASLQRQHLPNASLLSHSVSKCSVRLQISTTWTRRQSEARRWGRRRPVCARPRVARLHERGSAHPALSRRPGPQSAGGRSAALAGPVSALSRGLAAHTGRGYGGCQRAACPGQDSPEGPRAATAVSPCTGRTSSQRGRAKARAPPPAFVSAAPRQLPG